MSFRKIVVLSMLFIASIAYADNFRGKLSAEITQNGAESTTFPVDSLVSVHMARENDFDLLQGIELNITVPPEIRRYRDSFIINLYKNVQPDPSQEATSYYGELLLHYVLPSSSKVYIQIPLSKEHTLRNVQGTKIPENVSDPSDFPLMLTILPVMKGIPPAVYSAELEISVRPIYFPKGKLVVSVKNKDSGEEIPLHSGTVRIDDSPVGDLSEALPLRTGMHTLTVDIPGYEKETATFAIEQGTTSTISVELKRTVPTFAVEAPEEAEIFIDGTLFDGIHGRMEEIAPGTHTILFKIGDYSISKEIEIKEGKNYNISLFFDIFIKED